MSSSNAFNQNPNPDVLDSDRVIQFRVAAWTNGYKPLPVKTRSKAPHDRGWPAEARQEVPSCVRADAPVLSAALNTGILCDGLRVIDVDVDDAALVETIEAAARELLGDAPTRMRSDSPRILMVYAAAAGAPPKRVLVGKHGKVEVLGEGQQFVADGIHPDGRPYQWRGGSPAETHRDDLVALLEEDITAFFEDVATMIEADLASVTPLVREQPPAAQWGAAPRALVGVDNPRTRAWVEAAFNDEVEGVATCPVGSRNDQLNKAAFALGQFAPAFLSPSEVEAALEEAAVACGLTKDDGIRQVRATIASGLKAGMRQPREVPADIVEEEQMLAEAGRRIHRLIESARGRGAHPAEWPAPKPIKSSLPPVEPFRPDMLPEALRDYVMDVSDRQQSPPDFVAVVAVVGLASLIGNRVRMLPKQHDDWEIVPNLWGAIVGPPSAMKSPSLKSALAPIYAIEDEMRREWEEECEESRAERSMASLEAKKARKDAEKALSRGDREAAEQFLSEHSRNADLIAESDPPCPRLVVNDSTVEKLGVLLNENPRGLLLVRDELSGFLSQLDREDRQGERAFYLEAFNGDGRFAYDRIGRGTVHIENCTTSIIGGVQPSRIAPIVHGALSSKMDDGLIQRLQLTVWPDPQPSWKYVDRQPDAGARERYMGVFKSVNAATCDIGRDPVAFRFDPVAQESFAAWMKEIHLQARSGKLSPSLESHILKMPRTIASLALIFQIVNEGYGHIVSEEAWQMALSWASYLRSHAGRLYAAGSIAIENAAKLIVERRKQLPTPFTVRDIQRKGWAGLTEHDDIAAAMDILTGTHHCRSSKSLPGERGGRPSITFEWNPALDAG